MTRASLLASAAVGCAMLSLGSAQAQAPFDWSGFYAGIHGGYLSGDVALDGYGLTRGGPISGPAWGVLAGYNFAMSPIAGSVFGVEADVRKVDATGVGTSVDCAHDYLYDLSWDAHFRARLGFPQGNAMPFVAAGLALANLDITDACSLEQYGGLYTGGSVGAGLDLKLSPRAFGRVEALYDFYGSKTYEDFSADFHAWTFRAALAFMLP
jgi:outer membrane immunogenic protein